MAFKSNLSKEQQMLIVRDYEESGMSIKDIGEKYGISHNGMAKLLHRNGANVRAQGAHEERRAVTREQETEIIRLYAMQRMSPERIAPMYNCSVPAIRGVLERNAVEGNDWSHPIWADQERVIQLYSDGNSMESIAKVYGLLSFTAVKNILDANGIKRRDGSQGSRKYSVRHDAFSDLSEEQAAYWMGFIFADGYVNQKTNVLAVGLDSKDTEHLERLQSFLETTSPIRQISSINKSYFTSGIKERQYAFFQVSSKTIASDLISYGVVKWRTRIGDLVNSLPDRSFKHWFRGYYDGDGNGRPDRITVIGQEPLLDWIRHMLSSQVGTNPNIALSSSKGMFGEKYLRNLYYGGRLQVNRIAAWMYDEATVWLPRKRYW